MFNLLLLLYPLVVFIIGTMSVFDGSITGYQYWVLLLIILIYVTLIQIKEAISEKH